MALRSLALVAIALAFAAGYELSAYRRGKPKVSAVTGVPPTDFAVPLPLCVTRITVVDPQPEPGELPATTAGVFYRLNQSGCSAAAPLAGSACYAAAASTGSGGDAVYGRVARTATRIVLQYWLYYYDNPLLLPATPFGVFWQSHESDWELVNVVLDNDQQPVEAAYSQHCTGERMPIWIMRRGSTRRSSIA